MGKGIDAARAAGATIHADLLDDFKEQLLIVMCKRLRRLGDDLVFPVTEVDDTGSDTLAFSVDPEQRVFRFELQRKA